MRCCICFFHTNPRNLVCILHLMHISIWTNHTQVLTVREATILDGKVLALTTKKDYKKLYNMKQKDFSNID